MRIRNCQVANFIAALCLGALVCIVSSTTLAQFAASQTSRNAINGLVTDTARNPVPDLWIELLDEVDSMVARIRTDSTGHYVFNNLSFGTFQVRVVTSGTRFIGQTVRVNLSPSNARGTGSQYEQLDLILRTKAEATAGTASKTRATFVQDVPDSAKKVYESAVALLDGGKETDAGFAKLKEALQLFPDYYLALERLGIEYVKRRQYDDARSTLQKALEVNPSGANSLYALGVVHYQAKQWAETAEVLKRSFILDPESPNVAFTRYYLGLALLKLSKGSDAEPHLKQAIEKGGASIPADVHMHLAQYYSNNKRYKEAADELEAFLKQAPDARDADNIRNIIKQLREKAKTS